MKPVTPIKLTDSKSEQVRQDHARAIGELQSLPASSLRIISNVALPNGTFVQVPHGLGRIPAFVGMSVPHGLTAVGVVAILHSGENGHTFDETKYVGLQASFYGATIVVDVLVL